MKIVSTKEAEALTVSGLGFDSDYTDLGVPEALAAMIRKTASFLCPCRKEALVRAVSSLLHPLRSDEASDDTIREMVDSLVGYGDLIEANDVNAPSDASLLYLAAPGFVQTSEHLFLLVGTIPDGEDPSPPGLRERVAPVICTRRLRVDDAKEAADALLQAGFVRLKLDSWLKCPPVQSASELAARYDEALSKSGPPGTPEEVMILDPTRPVKYYKGRWTKLKGQSGRFVARRSQAYGSQLWCYIEATEGRVTRLLDFPLYENCWRAFDEAWHLLQAQDAVAGHPQLYRVRNDAPSGSVAMDLFSPPPTWATRRLDSVGQRTLPNSALLSYVFAETELDAECRFATDRMWLKRE
jgi:hypothetical protein